MKIMMIIVPLLLKFVLVVDSRKENSVKNDGRLNYHWNEEGIKRSMDESLLYARVDREKKRKKKGRKRNWKRKRKRKRRMTEGCSVTRN